MNKPPNQAIVQVIAILSFAFSVAHAGDQTGIWLLRKLQEQLFVVRDLPVGSRPNPPDFKLASLAGITKDDVRRALSEPNGCEAEKEDVGSCTDSASWIYVWGPPAEPVREEAGYITVTTGGPWLLVLDFAGDKVSSARWQGQR